MNVNVLSGVKNGALGSSCNRHISGVGLYGVDTSKRKDTWHKVNKHRLALAAGRTAVIKLFSVNIWGLATILNWKFATDQDYRQRFMNGWYNLGGDFNNFQINAINKGRSKRAFGWKLGMPKALKEAYTKYTKAPINGAGLGDIAATTALLVAAATILVPMMDIIKKAVESQGAKVNYSLEDPSPSGDYSLEDLSPSGGGYRDVDDKPRSLESMLPLILLGGGVLLYANSKKNV